LTLGGRAISAAKIGEIQGRERIVWTGRRHHLIHLLALISKSGLVRE
jgi:hypothetical protein